MTGLCSSNILIAFLQLAFRPLAFRSAHPPFRVKRAGRHPRGDVDFRDVGIPLYAAQPLHGILSPAHQVSDKDDTLLGVADCCNLRGARRFQRSAVHSTRFRRELSLYLRRPRRAIDPDPLCFPRSAEPRLYSALVLHRQRASIVPVQLVHKLGGSARYGCSWIFRTGVVFF